MSESTSVRNAVSFFKTEEDNKEQLFEEELPEIPQGVIIYEINGPLFFGASQKFQEIITESKQKPEFLILRVRHVPFIDATGINRLKVVYKKLQSIGTSVIISGANHEVKKELLNMGVYKDLGKTNICGNINEAIQRVKAIRAERT